MVKKKILIVDDDKLICWSLEKVLAKEGYEITIKHNGQEALANIKKDMPDILLLDLMLPDLTGFQILEQLGKDQCSLPVLVITAQSTVDSAVKAMKLGAFDYINKPFNMEEVKLAIKKALEIDQLIHEVGYHRSKESHQYSFGKIISNTSPMKKIIHIAQQITKSDASTILIQGESGTGKDMLGRTIHYQSNRSRHLLVEVNCTAIPETLLESELFGHEQGSFTDAKKRKQGLFELAEGGTILLEEIGDMPKSMQVKLLKVLEDRRFRRVGGVKDIYINVCVIATTNKDLMDEVEKDQFREDLYYRFNVITLTMPPLRKRKDDIMPLTQYFIKELNRQFRRNAEVLSNGAQKLFEKYNWPGNVRQLKNVLERILILEDTKEIQPEHLPEEIQYFSGSRSKPADFLIKLPDEGITLVEIEKNLVVQAIELSKNNQVKAAQLLNISRDALRRKMIKFDLL